MAQMKTSQIILVVAVIGIAAVAGGFIQLPTGVPAVASIGQQLAPTAGACDPNNPGITAQGTNRNPLNSTQYYTAMVASYVDSSNIVRASETFTAGPTRTYSTGVTLNCGQPYRVYSINDADIAAYSKDIGGINSAQDPIYVDLTAPNATRLEFAVLDSAYNNDTSDGTATGIWERSSATTNTNEALGSNGITTFTLKVRTIEGSAQWGSEEVQPYLCANFNTAVYSTTNGVAVSGGTAQRSATIPTYCSANGYDAAWTVSPLKSTDGERLFTITVRSDLGNPADADNIDFYMVDGVYYTGANGEVKSGTADDANADIGLATDTIQKAFT